MFIEKSVTKEIHTHLFSEGVLVAKKDYQARHHQLPYRNLEVIKTCQSLQSRGLAKVQFSWQYLYYSLTDEGVEFLRRALHLPETIVPRTHIKTASSTRPERPPRGPRREGREGRDGRDGRDGAPRRERQVRE